MKYYLPLNNILSQKHMGKTSTPSKIAIFFGLFLSTAGILLGSQDTNMQIVGAVTHVECGQPGSGEIEITVTGGSAPYTYSWTGPDGIPNVGVSEDEFFTIDSLAVGSYEVSVSDVNTANASDTYSIIEVDTTDPTISLKDPYTIYLNSDGSATIGWKDLDNGSSDICSETITGSLDKDTFSCAEIGSNTVTVTITDEAGNSASDSTTVVVEDTRIPYAIAKNITVQLDATGKITIEQNAVDDGSTGPCGMIFSTDITSFTCADVGDNPVVLTVTDKDGNNPSTANATVKVEDNTGPVLIFQPYTIYLDENGTVTITNADAAALSANSFDNCQLDSISIDYEYDPYFTGEYTCEFLGNNDVPIIATDIYGNTSKDIAQVTVADNIAPVIAPVAPITATSDPESCESSVVVPVPDVSDNCTGTIVGTRNDGKAISDPYPIGKTTITWTATDPSGNEAAPVQQDVIVKDEEKPASPTLEDIYTSCTYTFTPPITTDNCSGAENITATTEDPITYYPQNNASSHTVLWVFEDEAGNKTEVEQTVHITPIFAEFYATPVSCNGANDGVINIEATGGKQPFEYALDGGAFQANPEFTGLAAGIYVAKVKDAYGCIVSKTLEIPEPDPLQLTLSEGEEETVTKTETCFGASDGEIIINGTLTGGTGEYKYTVDNETFFSSPNIKGLPSGNYEVFIYDSNGCSLSGIITAYVDGPDQLTASLNPVHATCFGSNTGSIEITNPAGGNAKPYHFRINNGPWREASTSGYTFTDLEKGDYQVEMMDASGCIRFLETITITQPDELTGEITTTRTTTYGSATGTASVEAYGGNGMYTYEWIDSGGNMVNDTKSASNLLAGIYELIVTDGQGCTFREYVEIIDIISADITTQSACVNENDTIRTSYIEADPDNVLGGKGNSITFDYEWTFGEGASLPDGTTGYGPHTVTYDTTGDKTITLKVTDNEGVSRTFSTQHYVGACFEECDTANNFSAHDNSFYLGDANGVRMEPGDCSNDTPMYLWFVVDKSSNGYRLFTDYVYTVKDGNTTTEKRITNCFGKFVDGTFEDDVTGKGEVEQMTDGQLVRLNKVGTGANEIDWECDQILSIIHVTYKWSSQNKKSCEETNNNHCAATNETIKVATPIRAYAETTNTCYGENNGSIIVTASGGTGYFNYTATNTTTSPNTVYGPQSSNVFNSLPAGTYTVLVEDDKDMLAGQEAYFVELTGIEVVESDTALTASTEITQDIICYGGEGSAKVTAQGGTAPYTYQWNDNAQQKTAEATGLGAGTYTVTITDETGCYTNASVTLTQPTQLTTAKAGADNTSCGFNSITLQANTPTSGTGQWTIVSGPAGGSIGNLADPNATFTGTNGQYQLRWTISDPDQNQECYSSDDVWITIIEDCYYLDFDGKDDYVDFGNNYDLSTLDPNGQGAFSLETWVKLNSTKGRKTILSKKDFQDHLTNTDTGGYELVVSEGVVSFRWGKQSLSPDSSVPLNTRRWYHIAVTYSGEEAKLFVDGIEVKSETTTMNPGNTSAPFMLGATYRSGDTYTKPETHVNGWIEELRIWKKAISPEQLRFMMNQRLVNNGGVVKGHVLPMDIPGPLQWGDLAGYYRLDADEAEIEDDGTTKDRATEKVHGVLKNITTKQENTAPLPYFSVRDGNWNDLSDISSPNPTPWKFGQGRWDAPNSVGINNKSINWNIVETSHNISSGNKNITLLGLLSKEGTLNIVDPNRLADNEYNRGQYLRITHYLDLDGVIDLTGESQLLQDEGSILEEESSGYIERDQQGTASSYNYNYWSSPVSLQGNPNNSDYNVKGVLRDGTDPDNPAPINFNYQYHFADHYNEELETRISTFWIHIFTDKTSGTYSKWYNVRETGAIKTGEGYSMKGTSGKAAITDHQNYTFVGKPHNGTVKLQINPGNDYLIGNPYPSAIDGYKFIRDNIKSGEGTNTSNIFNGTLYFWDHFAGKTHYLQRYIGGYATLNLSGGIVAIASDARINATGDEGDKEKVPQQFIPVGQAFYVSTKLDEAFSTLETITGGDIVFNNSQRAFETDDQEGDVSNFKSREEKEAESQSSDKRQKIYLKYSSPGGLHRQLLVTRDEHTTTGFDLGYDAPLIENYDEDMYWMVQDIEFVIQGVPDLDKDRVLPLGLKVYKEGEITIAIDMLKNIPEDMEIYLRDSISDVTHDLREANFTLNLSEGTINDRFSLVFEKKSVPGEKGGGEETDGEGEEEGLQGELEFFYSRNEREITIKNPELTTVHKVIIYNALGQKLMEYNTIPRESLVKLPTTKYPAGVYILRLETDTGERSSKFIVN